MATKKQKREAEGRRLADALVEAHKKVEEAQRSLKQTPGVRAATAAFIVVSMPAQALAGGYALNIIWRAMGGPELAYGVSGWMFMSAALALSFGTPKKDNWEVLVAVGWARAVCMLAIAFCADALMVVS